MKGFAVTRQRFGHLARRIALIGLVLFPLSAPGSTPVLNVWYGPDQTFGQIGQPNEWINILGKVTDPDGISSLTYSLNGQAAKPLSFGPDNARLWSDGDFNVEIAYRDLQNGQNTVTITATDTLANQAVETVNVNYPGVNVWPRSYSIDWASVASIPDVAQIVDGLWLLEADSVRTQEVGYDRLIAIGDITWDNYEVTVPLTVHGLNPFCQTNNCGGGPKVGILSRWIGHFSVNGEQPSAGWQRLGAIGWVGWRPTDLSIDYLGMMDADGDWYDQQNAKDLPFETPHILKLRSETDGGGHTFSLKLWPQDQAEPGSWDIVAAQPFQSNVPSQGSPMLVSHHVDVSFGDVTVTPLGTDTTAPVISNVQVVAGQNMASVRWTSDEFANSRVDFGPTVAYENGMVTDDFYIADHRLTLQGLTGNTQYHYQITSVDASGNSVVSGDLTFTSTNNPAGIHSDQFNDGALDTSIWTFRNPAGDSSSISMTGTQAAISVPADSSHDLWQNENLAPRIMQLALDQDFEIEAKFDSALTQQTQFQGIIVEQDADDFIRVDFHDDGSNNRIFAASFINNTATTRLNTAITPGNPLYLRVKREGDLWTLTYSYDGSNWITAETFTHPMTVSAVGLFAGNAGSPPPAHTALIDYFVVNSGGATAPSISGQPQSQTVNEGQAASFTVAAGGTPPLSYQWRKDGSDLVGETADTLTLDPVSAGDAGDYQVIVSNSIGSDTSEVATLTVNVAPSISTDPQSQTVVAGDAASFTVVASGTPAPTYQWQKDGADMTGETATTLTLDPVAAADAGDYQVVVSNSVGTVTSATAALTVNVAPLITLQPADQSVVEGQTATFSVVAEGNPPPAYQWRRNGTDIAGATAASYTTPATDAADDGSTYSVVVSNVVDTVTSGTATLSITAAPVGVTVTTQPTDMSVNEGETAEFTVVASGTSPISYQWQKDGTDISGANSALYTTPIATAADNGSSYQVRLSNSVNSLTSAAATLTVNLATTITTQPSNQTVVAGATVSFSVVASGTAPLSYQWQKDDVDIAGANGASYTTPVTTAADDGSTYRVVVSNVVNSVTSTSASLTIDSNGDGISDSIAVALGLDPNDPDADTDNDLLSDVDEIGADINNPLDSDGDSVIDALEPGSDADDASVARGMPLPGGVSVTLATAAGEALSRISTTEASGGPTGISFPFGMITYTTSSPPGGSVTIRLTFSEPLPAVLDLYKVDDAGTYIPLPSSTWSQVDANTLVVSLLDGDPLTDQDGKVNSEIVDPLAPADASGTITTPASSGSGGGGGCTLLPSAGKDPTLPLLLLISSLVLFRVRLAGKPG